MAIDSPVERALLALHKAITPDDFWAAADRLLRAEMPVFHTFLGLPCLGLMPLFMRSTYPFPDIEQFIARIAELAPLQDVIMKNPGITVSRMSDDFSLDSDRARAWQAEVMDTGGWRFATAMLFWGADGGFLGQLSALRTTEQGDFTDAEIARLRELHPQCNAAVERLFALERQSAAHVSLENLVAPLPLPMVTVSWDLAASYSNSAARDAMNAWRHGVADGRAFKPGSEIPGDLLAACLQLKDAWKAALEADDFRGLVRSLAFTHAGEDEFRAEVRLVEPDGGRALQPSFVIAFHHPAATHSESAHALTRLAKLTRSEQEIARLAALGSDNSEISTKLGISPNTVRSHLRKIFEKLGITSRSRLAPLQSALAKLPSSPLIFWSALAGW